MRLNIIFILLLCSALPATVLAQSGEEWFEIGASYFDKSSFPEAIQAWEKAMEADPTLSANAWYNIGLGYAGMEQYEEAIKAWDKTIELAPESPIAYDNKGTALAILGRNDEAIACYDKAIELAPDESKYSADRDMLLTKMKGAKSPLSPVTALAGILIALGCVLVSRARSR
jgi:tetratricopeptide (TPR) repeat protein